MADADRKMIETYIHAIRREDRVTDSVYEGRLSQCKACAKLLDGTCQACGCYVELRALAQNGRCPDRKW